MQPKRYYWSDEKNEELKTKRDISFEEVIFYIADGHVLDIVEHPNQRKYKGRRIFIIKMNNYAWLVPFVETDNEIFLNTIIPSRKATKIYLGDYDDNA
jgi:uncharacterized DUF497 family protein